MKILCFCRSSCKFSPCFERGEAVPAVLKTIPPPLSFFPFVVRTMFFFVLGIFLRSLLSAQTTVKLTLEKFYQPRTAATSEPSPRRRARYRSLCSWWLQAPQILRVTRHVRLQTLSRMRTIPRVP